MEMSPRENMLAILDGKQPQYYGSFDWACVTMRDPIWARDSIEHDGQPHKDGWGTVCVWPVAAPGKHPMITDENAVVKDVTKWKEQLVIPSVKGLDWTACKDAAAQVNRDTHFVKYFCAQGLFERSHFLMGMENAFMAYMEEPEAMYEMLAAIAEYKKDIIKEAAYQIKPDVCFYQDDWGSKQNLFLPPDLWRELIKPLQMDISKTIHECGMIYQHHADCICEPIAEDMVDLEIDIWEGVIPENNIVGIQARTQGKLAMMGGMNGPSIDSEDTPDEAFAVEARRCIDTYCPGGRFFPSTPAPLLHEHNNELAQAAIREYGEIWATEHPIA